MAWDFDRDRNCLIVPAAVPLRHHCHCWRVPFNQLIYPPEADEEDGPERMESVWRRIAVRAEQRQLLLHKLRHKAQRIAVSQLRFEHEKGRILRSLLCKWPRK